MLYLERVGKSVWVGPVAHKFRHGPLKMTASAGRPAPVRVVAVRITHWVRTASTWQQARPQTPSGTTNQSERQHKTGVSDIKV